MYNRVYLWDIETEKKKEKGFAGECFFLLNLGSFVMQVPEICNYNDNGGDQQDSIRQERVSAPERDSFTGIEQSQI